MFLAVFVYAFHESGPLIFMRVKVKIISTVLLMEVVIYRIDNFDKMVHFAFNERAKRLNYRAVIEHDGLTWQPSQQEVRCLLVSFLKRDSFEYVYTVEKSLTPFNLPIIVDQHRVPV